MTQEGKLFSETETTIFRILCSVRVGDSTPWQLDRLYARLKTHCPLTPRSLFNEAKPGGLPLRVLVEAILRLNDV